MKYLGKITDSKDLVTKEYVDNGHLVFEAEFDTTSAETILQKMSQGYIVICAPDIGGFSAVEGTAIAYNGYVDATDSSYNVVFGYVMDDDKINTISVKTTAAGVTTWSSSETIPFENSGNKVTAISSSSTNAQYPSAKCVYDELENKQDAIDSTTELTVKTLTGGITYTTTAPTAANSDGIKIAVLDSDPATKYDGWLYLITE